MQPQKRGGESNRVATETEPQPEESLHREEIDLLRRALYVANELILCSECMSSLGPGDRDRSLGTGSSGSDLVRATYLHAQAPTSTEQSRQISSQAPGDRIKSAETEAQTSTGA